MTDKSMIILSGGLDSAVSLALEKDKSNIEFALFFNYGQKSFISEQKAVADLCKYYKINYATIDLPWLKKITANALTDNNIEIPSIDEANLDNQNFTQNTMKKVWIPNRNGLFLNIAAAFADSHNFKKIFIGANKEEAATFSDNSQAFIEAVNNEFKYSTQAKPIVVAPLINNNKNEIVKIANEIDFPFEYLWSCYDSGDKHCGKCESCKRLKRGLERNGLFDIVNLLFEIN